MLSSIRSSRRFILPSVKFLSRALTALNLLPSIATLGSLSSPSYVFVDGLDLGQLGFANVQALETGRPGYHPATLLKIYIYGYLNLIPEPPRLSRRLFGLSQAAILAGSSRLA